MAMLKLAVAVAFVAACNLDFGWSNSGNDQFPPTDGGVSFGPQPLFGPTVTQPVAPPPISGGTLTVLAGTNVAVAADPDRDRIYVVDVAARKKLADVALVAGDEPGRVLEDAKHRVHVVLRGGGALVTLDPMTWTIAARRPVCPAPRGVAYDSALDAVYVACAGGELVTLPAGGGAATRTIVLDRDLRDVVVWNGTIVVSRFRSAELITVDATGAIAQRATPSRFTSSSGTLFEPEAAWRIVVANDGLLYEVHQRATSATVHHTMPGGYGGNGTNGVPDPIVHSALTAWTPGLQSSGSVIGDVVLPVDLALSQLNGEVSVVSAGNAKVPGGVLVTSLTGVRHMTSSGPGTREPIAIAYTSDGHMVVQSREPAQLVVDPNGSDVAATIDLSADSRADTGHAIFHANASAGLACASCHLEGGDDGFTFEFDGIGARRTQSLRGNVFGLEPFHWDGDEADFQHLAADVFVFRMAGPTLAPDQLAAAQNWLSADPLLPKAPGDAAAIARGQALFEGAALCSSCHAGPKLTTRAKVDVGTGGMFKVPSLRGVIERAPFLHDGRAATLAARFDPSIGGGDNHGRTSQLSQAQLADLIAYVSSL
jgi:cytochrome c553/mono/diheme cytochrome c family protein